MTTDIDALVERPDKAPASYDAVVEAYEHMRDMCRQAQDGWSEERRKLWRAIDENARLRDLDKFARHDGLCAFIGGYGYCTCGLDAARAALQGDA